MDDNSTRTFKTTQGTVSYETLNDRIAEPYAQTLDAILRGEYDRVDISVDLLRDLHRRFVYPIMPNIAGKWRTEPVQVGGHEPPLPQLVDHLIRSAMEDFKARIRYAKILTNYR